MMSRLLHNQDACINIEIGLSRGGDGKLVHTMVKSRILDPNGKLIGKESMNPMTDFSMR